MWGSLLSRNDSVVSFGFIVSIILGSAAAYSKLYLFHVVLIVFLTVSLCSRRLHVIQINRKMQNYDVAFFLCFLLWYFSSIYWAPDNFYAVKYCVYIVLGALTAFVTVEICRNLQRLRAVLFVILVMMSVQIFLAIMEGFRLIRLPFSPYSPHRWIFGREPNSFEGLRPSQVDHVLSVPTGFMANPNNLSALLILVLPLFLSHARWWVAIFGSAAIYLVVDMTGARAGMVGFWVVIILAMALFPGYRLRTGVLAGFLVAVSVSGLSPVAAQRSSLDDYSNSIARYSLGLSSGQADGKDSVGIRVQLILNGLEALRESSGLGVGAGGSVAIQQHVADGRTGKILSMHNFWIEILVEGGLLFAAIFFTWCGWLVLRLWRIGRSAGNSTIRYMGQALCLGFMGFFFSAIGPSSVIYMLPMWMFIGLALATIRLDAEEKSAFMLLEFETSFSKVSV
jgi:teichuronic acid biosynthesis protein TuaE